MTQHHFDRLGSKWFEVVQSGLNPPLFSVLLLGYFVSL
jgi:hypothetical protein